MFTVLNAVVSLRPTQPLAGTVCWDVPCALLTFGATSDMQGFRLALTDSLADLWGIGSLDRRGMPDAGLDPWSTPILMMY